ncbi:DUF3263 domain-containing protein [Micromonospora mirobrigensis]|uniref:DUF3263 domain-containing protein n=1 Tax=Micromonospora mirobrigensis TaxID=262898 RepID=A0A1C4ZSM2_9ACTN|nr:DUF3263 domain-containing protein [Micromonospora mirobrigensis]SCF35784.1 Protein of unknown function (DUF3263) [Micromonospora mirobrigensis]
MSADASAAATGRPEPSPAAVAPGPAVPPPRSAPEVESTPGPEPDPPTGTESGPAVAPAATGLTERERRILDFEQQWWRHAGAKEQAVRETFGLSATRYYQLLNGLLDNPAALAAEPVLIARLRRLRSSRARNRRR